MIPKLITWFEIPAVDIARAKTFYQTVLGVETQSSPMPTGGVMEMFPMEPGQTGGAIISHPNAKPSANGVAVYFFCKDGLDGPLGKVEEAGGQVFMEKTSIGEFGFIAMFLDTEGNRLGLHSEG